MQRFGEKVRLLRKSHHMTVRELAKVLGYTAYSYISEIENSKTRPSLDFVLKAARYFHVSTDQLVWDELDVAARHGTDGASNGNGHTSINGAHGNGRSEVAFK